MMLPEIRRLPWIIFLILKKIVESILIVIALCYGIVVFDIYKNTEKLSKVNYSRNVYCEIVAHHLKFTKGPVVFRVDRGTLVFHFTNYFSWGGLYGYAPFFIFPYHKSVILMEDTIKSEYLDVMVAHELGHIQGGWKFLGERRYMEKYANNFVIEIVGVERYNFYVKYINELSKKESQE